MVLWPGFALSFSKGSNIYAVGLLFLRGVLCVCVWLKGGEKSFCVFVRKDQMLAHGMEGEFMYLPGDY